MKTEAELENITIQLINLYAPEKLLLFGSYAKKLARHNSDIDLCVITETSNKRELLTDMYLNIESDRPFDLLLYTPEEWESNVTDKTSFAYQINNEGVVLYGR